MKTTNHKPLLCSLFTSVTCILLFLFLCGLVLWIPSIHAQRGGGGALGTGTRNYRSSYRSSYYRPLFSSGHHTSSWSSSASHRATVTPEQQKNENILLCVSILLPILLATIVLIGIMICNKTISFSSSSSSHNQKLLEKWCLSSTTKTTTMTNNSGHPILDRMGASLLNYDEDRKRLRASQVNDAEVQSSSETFSFFSDDEQVLFEDTNYHFCGYWFLPPPYFRMDSSVDVIRETLKKYNTQQFKKQQQQQQRQNFYINDANNTNTCMFLSFAISKHKGIHHKKNLYEIKNGTGKDNLGSFTISGFYSGNRIAFRKEYHSKVLSGQTDGYEWLVYECVLVQDDDTDPDIVEMIGKWYYVGHEHELAFRGLAHFTLQKLAN